MHTHTTLSDGNSTPEQTILWYASHGYQFLALTDHNQLSHPARYAALQEPGFVLIPGEEITMTGNGRQVHVNALCTNGRIPGGAFATTSAALSTAIGKIAAQGGVAIVNHPNFDWGLSAQDVIDARDAPLLEIASGHPYVYSSGDATHRSHEQLWDVALSAGAQYMGVAVDDVHRIDGSGNPQALPGQGWVQAFSDRADAISICAALGRGDLYSSTGVELSRVAVTRDEYIVVPQLSDVTVSYVGASGRELARVAFRAPMSSARYKLKGDEGYVRARVDATAGQHAWTPAVRVDND
ncbi:MAG TPA: hypothetical protein VHC20_01585 [Candidatus Paceibacterota bacterium]|nr:hypothetical protein [Candidatus Paceibacterota bacterium]